MKPASLCFVAVLLAAVLVGCSPAPSGAVGETDTTGSIETMSTTLESYAALEAYFSAQDDPAAFCYLPVTLPQGFALERISTRAGVYVTAHYRAETSVTAAGLSDYDQGQMNSLTCQFSPSPDPETTIRISYVENNGYTPTVYAGKTFYTVTTHAGGAPAGIVIGYEVVYALEDGVIYLHLPPLGTLEEMLTYAAVERISRR